MKFFVSIGLTGRILAPKFPLGNERWLHRQKAWPSLRLRIRRRPTIPEKRRQDEPPHEPKCVLFLIKAGSAKWVEMKNSWCIFSVKLIESSGIMDEFFLCQNLNRMNLESFEHYHFLSVFRKHFVLCCLKSCESLHCSPTLPTFFHCYCSLDQCLSPFLKSLFGQTFSAIEFQALVSSELWERW